MPRTTRPLLPVIVTGFLAFACAVASATAADAAGATPLRPGGVVGGPRIVNGTLTSQYPSVGALLSPADPNIAGLVCSGTLIGCQTFLTAAHCVCGATGAQCQSGPNAPNPADYVVFFQHAGFFAVSAVQVRPDFDFPVGDVAILTLATPVTGIAPTPLDVTDTPGAGTSATIVGFGRNAGAEDYGLKRAGAVSMAPCVAGISNTTSVCWDFSDPLGSPGTDSDTCNGDSGGPLFAAFQCGDTVAGITSGGTSGSCTPTDHRYDANVFHYRDYIQTHAGTLGGTCGAMPQAGEAGAPIVAATGALSSGVPQAMHTIDVPVGTTSLRVALNASEDFSADFDLYLKPGSPPTTTDYDCKADGSNQYGFCERAAPAPGTWYALVRRAQSSGTYQLTATTFASGGPGSGFEGQSCDDGNACTASETCQAGACIGSAVANGSPCDDGTACTGPDVCQAGVCDSTPTLATSCIEPVLGGKASLSLKHGFPSSRNQLAWRWAKGDTTTLADFGDPTSSAGYELCVFDESGGVPQLALHAAIPAGAAWTPRTRGYRYRDVTLQHDGMRTLVLKDGPAGSASITVSAKGSLLDLPTLPLDQDATVTVQLRGANACFQARYSTNIRNDTQQFKARGD